MLLNIKYRQTYVLIQILKKFFIPAQLLYKTLQRDSANCADRQKRDRNFFFFFHLKKFVLVLQVTATSVQLGLPQSLRSGEPQ